MLSVMRFLIVKFNRLLLFVFLVPLSSISNELDLKVEKVKNIFSELSDSSFNQSCHSPHSNVLYFSEPMGNDSFKLSIVSCGEPILTIDSCSIHSQSSIMADSQNQLIRVSTDYGAVNIEDEDDYQNVNNFISIKDKRETTKIKLAEFDNTSLKRNIRDIILNKNSLSAIIVREKSVMFHYGQCGCTGIETVFHEGNLHNISSFENSTAYFEWLGCDKEITEYFSNKAIDETS